MKRALVALVAGTVLSGLAAAYASTIPRGKDAAPIKAELADGSKLAASN
ncbi:MAG: hypothetical protein V4574_13700 [Pseudomonadota bacterium]